MSGVRVKSGAFALALVACFVLTSGVRAGADTPTTEEVANVLAKAAPENPQDLLIIQNHVKQVLAKTVPCTIGLRIGGSSGSGVIVSKDGLVLTAGHVSGDPGRECQILMPDGKKYKGKTLGRNAFIDSGMIQITDKGEFPFAELATSADLKKGQWCIAIGHPKGYQTGRSPVVRVGRVLFVNNDKEKGFVRTDCVLVGGDSGGPLFDMDGKIIGIHSRIGPFITFNIHVPADTYRDHWDALAKGQVIQPVQLAYLGVKPDPDAKEFKVINVVADSPAAKAGVKIDDIITMIDGQKISTRDDMEKALKNKKPGNQVALNILRGEETLTLKLTLGKRPG